MSIALWKSILGLAKTLAVIVILASGFLFWTHRQAMARPPDLPDFAPEVKALPPPVARVTGLGIPLGRFQRAAETAAPMEQPKEEVRIEDEIQKLGSITNAIVMYPPYPDGYGPALIFSYKQAPGGSRTIRLGEALIERENPEDKALPLPHRFKFIGCERDPEHAGWTYFLFDMKCDGTDVQKARWRLETERTEAEPAKREASDAGTPVSTKQVYIGPVPGTGARPPEPAKTEPAPVETVPVEPVPEPVPMVETPAGSLFQEEEGAFAPTSEGIEYLKDNYERLLEETRTQTYRDRDGRAAGIRIVGIASASVANQFGVRKDDVIVSINGAPVGTQSEAVNVVKGELRKKARVITVKILRHGRVIEKRFDTRDPATRRAAMKSYGNR
jgi:hypothetical protein